jgi:uncharacterized protein
MQYVWDRAKDVLNRRKHGLRLADGIPPLEDPDRESWTDDRFEYGEIRVVTLGLSRKGVLYVVSTEPAEERTRIISVRRAEEDELERYGFGRT